MNPKLYYVIGPPGCGKTSYVARQARNAVERHGTGGVAIGSFTRAAAIEIGARDTGVDPRHIGTLHSWCWHGAGRPVLAESQVKEWNEAYPNLKLNPRRPGDVDRSDPLAGGDGGSNSGDKLLSEMNLLRAKLIDTRLWKKPLLEFATKWSDWKEQNAYLDFTDLLLFGLDQMDYAPGNPRVLFIDEAQDNNPLQNRLIEKWSAQTSQTVLCGDPDQAIYSFAGSDPYAFYAVPDTSKLFPTELRQSWRLPAAVRDWCRTWVQRIARRDDRDFAPRCDGGEVIASKWSSGDGVQLAALIEEYEQAGTVALLAPCGYMLTPTIRALRERGVPFWNRYRASRGDWNPLGRVGGRVTAFLAPCGEAHGKNAHIWTGAELYRWSSTVRAEGVFVRGAKAKLKPMKEQGPVLLTELMELFEDGVFEELLGRMDAGAMAALEWLTDHAINDAMLRTLRYPIAVAQARGVRALLEEPKVEVGTGHSFKGGQSDTIIAAPDLSPAGAREWSGGGEARDALVRLGYVMGSRARERLVLLRGVSGAISLW